jgi:tRNA G10  N-methylase Trm11
MKIQQIPDRPILGATYSFDGLARNEVAGGPHGLHKYPAKFIPQIPGWALEYDNPHEGMEILDPFCGSGTTLVEGMLRGHRTLGNDISPLAVLMTEAKTGRPPVDFDLSAYLEDVLDDADARSEMYDRELRRSPGEEVLGMHRTWSNWFRPQELSQLLGLAHAIQARDAPRSVTALALATLSSKVKASSFLDEDQIKVRRIGSKDLAAPFPTFHDAMVRAFAQQRAFACNLKPSTPDARVTSESADGMSYPDGSIDRIITSPPYINAVDYTMNQKYNQFILGLVDPKDFKEHSRTYIGASERSVTAEDISRKPTPISGAKVQTLVNTLWRQERPVARNRAFVVATYFDRMLRTFVEFHRVLKSGGRAIFVIGETNNVCGLEIPTASLLEELARDAGLTTHSSFFHEVANRSSMRMNRASTGGSIRREVVYVFAKD